MTQVSIIITSYNYEKYIEKCILSCINQKNFDDFEVIVVDDGSSDNTKSVLEKYSDCIRYFVNQNQGIEKASNFGIKQAKGEFFVRVDADDMLDKNYLQNVVPLLQNSKYAFVYSDYSVIDGEDKIISTKKLPDFDTNEIKNRGDFLATGTIYKKNIFFELGLYNEETKNCGLENFELTLNILKNGYIGLCTHLPLFYYRQHGTNVSLVRRESIIDYGEKLAKKYNLLGYKTNENHPWGLKL